MKQNSVMNGKQQPHPVNGYLHLLPAYSPDCNPIERVWWHLHEAVTRNHQCGSMQELLDLTFTWLGERNPFEVEGLSVYWIAA